MDPGTNIWTRDLEIGPGLARGGFGTKNGGPKNMVLLRNGLQIGRYGISHDPSGLYGTQEAFGKASFPQKPLKTLFPSTFPNFGKFGEVPLGPLYISYGPFVGHIPIQLPINHPRWPLCYNVARWEALPRDELNAEETQPEGSCGA